MGNIWGTFTAKDSPKENNLIKSKGTWEFDVELPVNIRDAKTGAIVPGVNYKTGNTVVYDKTYNTEGYTWVEYTGNSGARRKVVVAKGNTLWGKNV